MMRIQAGDLVRIEIDHEVRGYVNGVLYATWGPGDTIPPPFDILFRGMNPPPALRDLVSPDSPGWADRLAIEGEDA